MTFTSMSVKPRLSRWARSFAALASAVWLGTRRQSIFATARLARPDPGNLRRLWLLALPIGLLLLVGIDELVRTPPGEWLAMWLGHSWKRCPWLVLILSAPIFIGLLWSFRRLAPTRLRAAGAAAGLAAGAFAATVYCLHCGEVSAIFVLTW